MKKFMLILMLAITAIQANVHECLIDDTKSLSTQIQSCKVAAIRAECEQRGVDVWSKTYTDGNTLQADEIKTKSTCSNMNIQISNIDVTDSVIVVTYTSITDKQEVHQVSMEQWGNLSVASEKVSSRYDRINRADSTTLMDVAVALQVDSREIKKKLLVMKAKSIRIAQIIMED